MNKKTKCNISAVLLPRGFLPFSYKTGQRVLAQHVWKIDPMICKMMDG